MKKYFPVIGMEVHVELKTRSKMFSPSKNHLTLTEKPNSLLDPVVLGLPGALPVPNAEAIRFVQLAGVALGCELARESKFDRKNYFYPDLPKGYQISQFDQPLCANGHVHVGKERIGITRIHMEEDTGKLSHVSGASRVDFNRAGVPLMELVTEPDLASGEQARAFCQQLQNIFRYINISDADMEKGHMRCEVNISLYEEGSDRLSGTKVEIKNLNSFRVVEHAANYEIERQTKVLEAGKEVKQETRGWDEKKQRTVAQRVKEEAHDYRYFPEPDIPPLVFDDAYIKSVEEALPELPEQKRKRLHDAFGIREEVMDVLIADKKMAEYFEEVVSEIGEKKVSGECAGDVSEGAKLAANYLSGEVVKLLSDSNASMKEFSVSAENFAELITLLLDGNINSSAGQKVLHLMAGGDSDDPSQIVERENLGQISDAGALHSAIDKVLAENAQSVADFKAGKDNAMKHLMGQTMKETQGKANPEKVREILLERLSS